MEDSKTKRLPQSAPSLFCESETETESALY